MTTQHDLSGAAWRKSSFSDGGNQCVEVATNLPGVVPVRDSKNLEGPPLVFRADSFALFVNAVNDVDFGTS
ncbi:DUF397 domain-containing protein [Streptomyces sp. NPDC047082]|uniref:DUF397 domain-containing protein n=1 Tax=Streptomyces sp. NPDC047082 TaxID=3155259 RepID=UPI0033FCD65E